MDELGRKTVEEFKEAEKLPVIAVLENVRSAYNVGSVLRTADAFLLAAVYTTGYTPHPPHKQIDKTALGAHESVHCEHFTDANAAIAQLRQQGYTVYAVEQTDNSTMLNDLIVDRNKKIAMVFGNEVSGVEAATIAICDGCVEIPQMGMKHSLNISVAAGVVLWELVRKVFIK
jgi:23S rRNA (guanosine2251-2'-O)-methyltransferase